MSFVYEFGFVMSAGSVCLFGVPSGLIPPNFPQVVCVSTKLRRGPQPQQDSKIWYQAGALILFLSQNSPEIESFSIQKKKIRSFNSIWGKKFYFKQNFRFGSFYLGPRQKVQKPNFLSQEWASGRRPGRTFPFDPILFLRQWPGNDQSGTVPQKKQGVRMDGLGPPAAAF